MKRVTRMVCILLLSTPVLLGAAPDRKDKRTSETRLDSSPSVAPNPEQATIVARETASTPTLPPSDPVAAPAGAASTYAIDWSSINGGGTVDASSPNYRMGASIGQSVTGAASSTNYQMGIGFWYGGGGSGCVCACHSDPLCDGVRVNSQDVVSVINVAFRGGALLIDGDCALERTDVDCNTFTNSQDVVRIINVAFRGANIASEFCDACP